MRRRSRIGTLWIAVLLVATAAGGAAELPGHYFKLLESGLASLDRAPLKSNPGAMLAAAVLYCRQHAANPAFGDKSKLELALKLGDLLAAASEQDQGENKQDYEWDLPFWLDAARLLDADLGSERRARWHREIEKLARWYVGQVALRVDFPRYQTPYIHTSTNHLAMFSSIVYLSGRLLANKEWEALGARALHRLAVEEQTPDGFWGELSDNGPATGYNYVTTTCVALYWEHSHDAAALAALRRATDFHEHFTWPDGVPVETIDGRNRGHDPTVWGHFAFSNWPDGRGYAQFLAGFFAVGKAGPIRVARASPVQEPPTAAIAERLLTPRELGRIAQSALYYHEGPTAAIPQQAPHFVYEMKVHAGIRKTGPWTVCLSGLIDTPVDNQFMLDRQGHLSIFHDKLGLIVTGANSKHQPELATILEKVKDRSTTIPLGSRLRMSDDRDRLDLGYSNLFAEIEVPPPAADRMTFRFTITETQRGAIQDSQVNLQLCLKAGEALETAKSKIVLGEKRIELGPAEIGGWIRHHGWTMRVDPSARLVWPVYPFNPYKNAPETDLSYAVGALSVPLNVSAPASGGVAWRRQEIEFALEAAER